jgi:hypothetical protein
MVDYLYSRKCLATLGLELIELSRHRGRDGELLPLSGCRLRAGMPRTRSREDKDNKQNAQATLRAHGRRIDFLA